VRLNCRQAAAGIAAIALIAGASTLTSPAAGGETQRLSFTKPHILNKPSGRRVSDAAYAPAREQGGIASWVADRHDVQTIRASWVDERGRPDESVGVARVHDDYYLEPPSLAVTANGTAVIAWSPSDPTPLDGAVPPPANIDVATLTPEGNVGDVHRVDHADQVSVPATLADSSGRPIVAWAAYDVVGPNIVRTRLRWVRLDDSGEPDGPVGTVPLGVGYELSDLAFAIDAGDEVTAAWLEAGQPQIRAVRFGLDGSRGPLLRLGSPERIPLELDLAGDVSGDTTIVWRDGLGRQVIQGVSLDAAGHPGPVIHLSPATRGMEGPALAVDDAGNAVAAWTGTLAGDRRSVHVLAAPVESGANPAVVTSSGILGEAPDIAAAPAGRFFVTWERVDRVEHGNRRGSRVKVAALTAAGAPVGRADLGKGRAPEIGVGGAGGAIVRWRIKNGPHMRPLAIAGERLPAQAGRAE
jgi:hypothetical protein